MRKNLMKIGVFIIFFVIIMLYRDITAINIPILTYHDIVLENATNSLQVTSERFLEDMTYLKEQGYTPLLSQDLLKIMEKEMEMPEKPIVITFDDGYISNYTYAYPALQQTQMKAIIAITTSNIRDDLGNGNEHFLSFSQCLEMYESGLVDIQNHTHDLHNRELSGLYSIDGYNGIAKFSDESVSEYRERLYQDLKIATEKIEENIGCKVVYFAYPYGKTEIYAYTVLKDLGIEIATTTQNGIADFSGNTLKLSRINVTMNDSLEDLLKN